MTKDIQNEEVVVRPTASIKKLTPAELSKQNEVLDGTREFTVLIGEQEYKLEHDLFFRNSKQNKLLEDMVAFFSASAEDVKLLEMATPYTALLILKHFTSLDVADDIREALDLLAVLVDLDVLSVILNELPEKEVVKVYELLTKTVNGMTDNFEEIEKEVLEVAQTVENVELKDMLLNKDE